MKFIKIFVVVVVLFLFFVVSFVQSVSVIVFMLDCVEVKIVVQVVEQGVFYKIISVQFNNCVYMMVELSK